MTTTSTLLDQPAEAVNPEPADDSAVVVSGPDGAEYGFAVPDGATPAEVAAIAASVSAALSAHSDPEDADDTTAFDAWTWSGRQSSTGWRSPPTDGTGDSWKFAGRPGLF